jgi:hypothetical protein
MDLPAAEEKNGEDGGEENHLHVFGKRNMVNLRLEYSRKYPAMISLFLRQVKGDLDLGHAASQEKQESGKLREDAPQGMIPQRSLPCCSTMVLRERLP